MVGANAIGSQADSDDATVRHLIELGYVDPLENAALEVAKREGLKEQLKNATELKRQGRSHEAAALLMKIAAEGPEWAIPHLALAEIYYTAGDWIAAEGQLEWLAHHGVDQPRVALIAAGIALVRRDMQSALKEVEFARDVEPELASVHMMLGTVLLRLGRWDDAEDAFREAVRQDPRDARSRDGLATVALHHGEFEDALDWALRALEQEPGLFSAHYHLGLALMWLNQPEEAIAALEAAARIDAHRAAPFYWLTRIARDQLGEFARASKYSEQARQIIQRRPNHSRSTISSK